MSTSEINPVLESMRAEKRSVALNSLLAAMAITFLKLLVGLSSHSLGILSEAAHSGLDLIAAFITLLSLPGPDLRLGARPRCAGLCRHATQPRRQLQTLLMEQ